MGLNGIETVKVIALEKRRRVRQVLYVGLRALDVLKRVPDEECRRHKTEKYENDRALG